MLLERVTVYRCLHAPKYFDSEFVSKGLRSWLDKEGNDNCVAPILYIIYRSFMRSKEKVPQFITVDTVDTAVGDS